MLMAVVVVVVVVVVTIIMPQLFMVYVTALCNSG